MPNNYIASSLYRHITFYQTYSKLIDKHLISTCSKFSDVSVNLGPVFIQALHIKVWELLLLNGMLTLPLSIFVAVILLYLSRRIFLDIDTFWCSCNIGSESYYSCMRMEILKLQKYHIFPQTTLPNKVKC
jgi:hypothetical protein